VGALRDRARLLRSDRKVSDGKLKDAARVWATGGAADLGQAAGDADQFGIPELAERLRGAQAKDQGFGVWRENWDIVIAFLSVASQWTVIPLASGATYWLGLDYKGVDVGLGRAEIELTPAQWRGLRTMETAARDALNGVQG